MKQMDRRQMTAVRELVNSGAIVVMAQSMMVRVLTESVDNVSLRDDRETRARLEAIKEFDREVQALINQMGVER